MSRPAATSLLRLPATLAAGRVPPGCAPSEEDSGARSLRTGLQRLLDGWRSDLSPAWSAVLNGVEPAFAQVDPQLRLAADEVIFPGRKGHAPPGARPDSHMFRALDCIEPNDVTVVVVGQDPYTHVEQATGRSFEQGDLQDWFGKPRVSPSLRRVIQALVLRRTGDRSYADPPDSWKAKVVPAIVAHRLTLAGPEVLWNRWQEQGVVFINAILTFNRFDPAYQFRGHRPLWAPIVGQLLRYLAMRPGRPVVFVAWGGKAQSVLGDAGVEAAAKSAGTWGRTVRVVAAPHPNAPPPDRSPFLVGRDPFADIDAAVGQCGGTAIEW